MVEKTEKKF